MGFVTHALGSITHAVGGIVGDVTDTLGLTNHHAQQEANNRANQAQQFSQQNANRAYGMSQAQLNFQKQQYADWKDLYGTTQEKLAHYVNNYNGANVVANQLQQNNLGAQHAEQNISRTLAQRGIGNSGLEAQALTQIGQNQYQNDASIRNNQQQIAAGQQMKFLGLGLGQGTQMLGTIGGVSNNGVNSQTNLSGQQSRLASNQYGASEQFGLQGMQNKGNLLGGMFKGGLL